MQDEWKIEKIQRETRAEELHDKIHALEFELQQITDMRTSAKGYKTMLMLKTENEILKKEMAAMQAAMEGKHAEITQQVNKGEKLVKMTCLKGLL